MELRQLKYFVAIAQQGSFQGAANKLFIAQPALSRQISELEKELQVKLFDRVARGVALTPGGQAFLHDVEKILADLEHSKKRVAQSAHGMLGNISVGLVEYYSWHRSVVGAISKFREEHPSVELTLATLETSLEVQRRIVRGALDCGFMFNRMAEDEKLSGKKILSTKFLLAVSTKSPISKAKKICLADLAKEPFVWFPREIAPLHYDRLLMLCNQAGFSPRIEQYATTETGRLSMVAAGAGCALVTSAAEFCKPEQVELVELSDIKSTIDLELTWRPDNNSPALKNFIQAVEQQVRESKLQVKRK